MSRWSLPPKALLLGAGVFLLAAQLGQLAEAAPPAWTFRHGLAYTMVLHATVDVPPAMVGAPRHSVDAAGSLLACADALGVISFAEIYNGPTGPAYQLACGSNEVEQAGLALLVYDAALDCVLPVQETLDFAANTISGDIFAPRSLLTSVSVCPPADASSTTTSAPTAARTDVAITGAATSTAAMAASSAARSVTEASWPSGDDTDQPDSKPGASTQPASPGDAATTPATPSGTVSGDSAAAVCRPCSLGACEHRLWWLYVVLGAMSLLALVLAMAVVMMVLRARRRRESVLAPAPMGVPSGMDKASAGPYHNPLFSDQKPFGDDFDTMHLQHTVVPRLPEESEA